MVEQAMDGAKGNKGEYKQNFACGIDLGTTFTVCYVRFPGSVSAQPVSTTTEKFIPSVVAFDNGRRLVGMPALNMIESGKPGVTSIRQAKMLMGKVCKDISSADRRQLSGMFTCELDYSLEDGPPRFIVSMPDGTKKLYRPEEIASMVLSKVKEAICKTASLPEETKIECVVTVPARFGSLAKSGTKDAGDMANLNIFRLTTEPTAAAITGVKEGHLTCPKANEDPKLIMVCDIGGGTSDLVLMHLCEDNVLETLHIDGNPFLGGNKANTLMVDRLLVEFRKQTGMDPELVRKDSRAMALLWKEVEHSKKHMDPNDPMGTEIEIFNLIDGKDLHYTYRYDIWEKDLKPMTDEIASLFDRCMKESGKSLTELKAVVCMGGSCRLKPVKDVIVARVGLERTKANMDFDNDVAKGACHICEMVKGYGLTEADERDEMVLLDVCQSSYRIETKGEIAVPIIERGAPYPTSNTVPFTTASPSQDTIEVKIMEGESEIAPFNKLIGSFMMHGVRSKTGHRPTIEVTAKIDVNGLLTVSAVDKETKQEKNITIESMTMTKEEREKYMAEQKQRADEEKNIKALLVVKNEIVTLCEEIKEGCKKINETVPPVVEEIYNSVVDMRAINILNMTSEKQLVDKRETLKSDPTIQAVLLKINQAENATGCPDPSSPVGGVTPPAAGPSVHEAD